jgi:hypothetical protein
MKELEKRILIHGKDWQKIIPARTTRITGSLSEFPAQTF